MSTHWAKRLCETNFRGLLACLVFFVGVRFVSPVLNSQTSTPKRGLADQTTSPAPSLQRPGSYYALLIGISNYPHLPKLSTPVNDAVEIAEVLHEGTVSRPSC